MERGVSAGGALARQTGVSGADGGGAAASIFQTCGSEGAASVAERLGGYTIGAPRPDVPASTPGTFRGIAEYRRPPRVGPRRRVTLARSEGSRISGGGDAKPVLHRRARPPEPLSLVHMPNSHEYTVRHNISKARSSGVSWTRGLVLNEGDNFGGDDTPSAIHSQSSELSLQYRFAIASKHRETSPSRTPAPVVVRSRSDGGAAETKRGGRELAAVAIRDRGRGDGLLSLAVRSTGARMGMGMDGFSRRPARHVVGDAEFAEGFAVVGIGIADGGDDDSI